MCGAFEPPKLLTSPLASTLFGGPSQPEPLDERGGIRAAHNLSSGFPDVINPNQYENDNVSNEIVPMRWCGLSDRDTELESPCSLDRPAAIPTVA